MFGLARWLLVRRKSHRPAEARAKRLGRWARRNRDVVQFCLLFTGLTIGLNLLYSRYENSDFMIWYSTLNAKLVHQVYELLGLSTHINRYTVTVNGFSMSIAPVCSAVSTMVIYLACIAAYPTGDPSLFSLLRRLPLLRRIGSLEPMGARALLRGFLRGTGKKLLGLLIGFPALALVNFGRLLLLGYLGYTNQSLFEFVHLYLFQVVFIVFVIVLWLTWIDKIVRDASKDLVPA